MAYGDAPTSYFIVTYHNIPLSAFDPTAEGNQLEFNRKHCLSFHTAKEADAYLARICTEGNQAAREKAIQKLHVSSRAKGWHNVPFQSDPVLLITMDDVIKRIERCLSDGRLFDWLGYLENRHLDKEVERLFSAVSPSGATWYDWVNGNYDMQVLERRLIKEFLIKHPERYIIDFTFMYHYLDPHRSWAATKETP